MAANKADVSFDEIIKADRKKKAAQDLAQNILGSKKLNAPGAGSLSSRKQPSTGPGASLASRVGVTKRSSSAQPRSNIDGKWGHDLHHVNNPQISRTAQLIRTSSSSNVERGDLIYSGIQRDISNGRSSASQVTIRPAAQLSIRGMAKLGPFVVVASNFAPGTTAADIEAAMEPVGGEIQSCNLVSSRPTVMCELVFTEREGADNVVATFNNQKADGRLLYVYHKQGGPSPHLHPLQTAPSKPARQATPPPTVTPVPAPEPPTGPRNRTGRILPPATRDDRIGRDLMDVDDDRTNPNDSRSGRDPRYGDRDRHRDLQRERDRDRNGYTDGRYGFREQYEDRRDPRQDYQRGGRGARGLYSDGMYPERQYRP